MPGSEAPTAPPPPLPRLDFLDGLRGLAALYVVLHHAALAIAPRGLGSVALAVRYLLRHGHYAVAVFIVVSGYCLMLPVARDPAGRLRGGVGAFFARRAKRILPPYYAALALGWLLIALIPAMGHPDHSRWDRALPAFEPGVVVSHLLLVHNGSGRWFYKINPPLWSVATEWQIYGFFPILLAVWRRAGMRAAVAAGFAFGYAVSASAGVTHNLALRELCPWYAGLFALGMAAAVVSNRPAASAPLVPTRSPRAALALTVLALTAAGLTIIQFNEQALTVLDPLVGAATALLIVRWARLTTSRPSQVRPPLLRLLESRAALALGSISYSLYLIHLPLLSLADAMLRARHWGPEGRMSVLLLIASPLCVLAAALFHRAFERPFLPRRRGEPEVSGPVAAVLGRGPFTSESSGSRPEPSLYR